MSHIRLSISILLEESLEYETISLVYNLSSVICNVMLHYSLSCYILHIYLKYAYIYISFIQYKRLLVTVLLTHNYIYSGQLDIFYVPMGQGYKKNCEIFLNWLHAIHS